MNNSLVGIVVTFLAITVTFPLVGGQLFSFYKLSLQWPNSACKSMTCLNNPTLQYFTIHGLWPHYAHGPAVPPYFKNPRCTNVPSIVYPHKLLLTSIGADLNRYWPNLKGPNDAFWKHEWVAHGMCSGYGNQPLTYFNLALSLTKHHNIRNILRRQGIEPNNTITYDRERIFNAIQQNLIVSPEIHCNMDYSSGNPVIQLSEVRLCFNSRTKRLRNCLSQYSGNCGGPGGQIRFTAP